MQHCVPLSGFRGRPTGHAADHAACARGAPSASTGHDDDASLDDERRDGSAVA